MYSLTLQVNVIGFLSLVWFFDWYNTVPRWKSSAMELTAVWLMYVLCHTIWICEQASKTDLIHLIHTECL